MTWHSNRPGSHRVVNLQVMSVQGVTDMRGSSSELHQQGEVRRPVDLPPSSPLTPLQNGVSGPVPTTGSVDPTAASPQDDARPDHQQAVATMETAQVRDDSVGQDGRDGQIQVLPGGQAVVQEHAQPAGEPAAQQGGVGLRLQQSGSNHLHQGATGVNEVAAVQDDARPSGLPDNINYETPRSQVSRRSMIPSPISAADGPSPSALPRALKWITGIGEYFNIRSVGESFAGPAFAVPLTAVALQRLRAMEGSAPLLYSPSDAIAQRGERHSSDSSDLPRDVIQQEVARQLGELTNRVQAAEAENQQLRQRLTFMTEVGQATEGSTGDRVSGVGSQPLPSAVPTGQATQRPLRQQLESPVHIPTPPYLASLSPSEQKEALATVLLPQVRQLEEDHAGVILDVLLQEDNLVVLELLRQPSLLQQRVFEVQQSLGLRVGLDGVGGMQGWQGHSGDNQGSSLRLSPPQESSQVQVATTARQGFAALQDTASTFLASLFRQSQPSGAPQSQVRPESELPGVGKDHRSSLAGGLAGGLEGGLGGGLGGSKAHVQQSHAPHLPADGNQNPAGDGRSFSGGLGVAGGLDGSQVPLQQHAQAPGAFHPQSGQTYAGAGCNLGTGFPSGSVGWFGSSAQEPSQSAHAFPQISTRPVPPVSAADPAQRYMAPPQTWNQSPELVSALANSVRQLQELQQSALKGAHATTESSPTSPEAVKPGVTTLSPLPLESEPEAPLLFQDWVHVTGGVAMDLSDSSGEWWGRLVEEIQKAYARWQSASPLDRAAIQPDTARVDLPKWVRVNARFATMLMSVLPAGLKADVISRGCATSSLHILFRMFLAYQPGGGAERTRILQALQDPGQAKTPQEAVTLLRSWNRWFLRCQECRLNPPDTMILSRGLTNLVGPLMATHQDINFRLQCSRSMLHIDRMPTLDETKEYAKHILSEMEIAAAAVNSAGGPKLRALGQATQPNHPPQSLQRQPGTKPICKYFMSDKGCRKGPACAYLHDMSSLDKAQRSRKCLKCGSTEHRQKQCPSVTGKPPAESPGGKAKGGAPSKAPQPTSPASSVTPTSPVSPVGLAQITQPVLDSTQLVVNPPAKPTSSSSMQAAASPIAAAVSGPAASGANLAALGLGGQTSGVDIVALDKLLEQAQAQLRAIQPQVGDGSPQAPSPKLNMMTTVVMQEASFQEETESASALLDSGATHALRPSVSQREWQSASEVQVQLAGDQTGVFRMSDRGTLLNEPASPSQNSQVIVPLGPLIEKLGYRLSWSRSVCKLQSPEGRIYKLRIKSGCPQLQEHEALKLITQLEQAKLQKDVTQLEQATADTSTLVEKSRAFGQRTWFHRLMQYARDGSEDSACLALTNARGPTLLQILFIPTFFQTSPSARVGRRCQACIA